MFAMPPIIQYGQEGSHLHGRAVDHASGYYLPRRVHHALPFSPGTTPEIYRFLPGIRTQNTLIKVALPLRQ